MTTYQITHIVRQNPWRLKSYKLDYVQGKYPTCPWGHSLERCNDFLQNIKLPNQAEKFIQELKINNIVMIPYKNDKKYELLIVKIKSQLKSKLLMN